MAAEARLKDEEAAHAGRMAALKAAVEAAQKATLQAEADLHAAAKEVTA